MNTDISKNSSVIMSNEQDKFEIRDLRRKEYFQVDDVYLNGYARICGIYATGVYITLCRHADNSSQACFPSIGTIARKLNISERQVIRAIEKLKELNIIKKVKTDGKHNTYYLVDKRFWKSPQPTTRETSDSQSPLSHSHHCPTVTTDSQSPVTHSHRTSDSQSPDQCPTVTGPVTHSHSKDTHIRNSFKETHLRMCNADESASTHTGKKLFLEHVLLTDEEHQKLIDLLGGEKTQDYIIRLNDYIHQIGKQKANAKYKSHYHVILNWHRRDMAEVERRLRVAEVLQQRREEEYL